jgi:cysteine desulfurase
MRRVYLDHNATSPLRREAKAAMLAAMDALGNPSSVHSEGRAAKAIVEKARGQISEAFGVGAHDIVFTASATEAAALALKGRGFHAGDIEHDAIAAWVQPDLPLKSGQVCTAEPAQTALQLANSETGIVQSLPQGLGFCDMTQGFGKLPLAFSWSGADMACASAHKLGGPKGVGCLLLKPGVEVSAQLRGGGQEMGRRAGTENIIGIAGFGSAAAASARDLSDGKWAAIEKLRNILEKTLEASGKPLILVGTDSDALAQHRLLCSPRMERRDAGHANGPRGICSVGRFCLLVRQSQSQPRSAGDGI